MERRSHKQEQNNAVSHSEEEHPEIVSTDLNFSSVLTQKYKCKNIRSNRT